MASERSARFFLNGLPVVGVILAGLCVWAGIATNRANRYLFFVLAVWLLLAVPFSLWLRAKVNTGEAQERLRKFRQAQQQPPPCK
ncbi:MAG: hypothetical protein ACJ71T_02505 [Actinomycetales bacterium]